MKKGLGISPQIILLIAGFLLFVLAMVMVFHTAWPWVRYGIFSPCWASTMSSVNKLSNPRMYEKPQTIEVGDCLSVLAFKNKADLEEFNEKIFDEFEKYAECPEDKESYIIAIPRVSDDVEAGGNPLHWPKAGAEKAWEYVKKIWREKMGGIKPYCKGFDKPISNTVEREAPEEGTNYYCMTVIESESSYRVSIANGKCEEE